jgi:hypothetical protein
MKNYGAYQREIDALFVRDNMSILRDKPIISPLAGEPPEATAARDRIAAGAAKPGDGLMQWLPTVAPDAFRPADFIFRQGDFDSGTLIGAEVGNVGPATCLTCSSPATHTSWCVYCHRRECDLAEDVIEARTLTSFSHVIARTEREEFDRRNRPRETASSRELAKPHPWQSDEGEP